jgi:hypothetical protein
MLVIASIVRFALLMNILGSDIAPRLALDLFHNLDPCKRRGWATKTLTSRVVFAEYPSAMTEAKEPAKWFAEKVELFALFVRDRPPKCKGDR